jgi:hypothetical protein
MNQLGLAAGRINGGCVRHKCSLPNRWGLLAAAALGAPLASGSIINGGDGSQNTTAPAGLTNWNNVGYLPTGTDTGGSGVYLGNGWVLTAAHAHGWRDNSFGFSIPGLSNGQDAVFFSQPGVYQQLRIAPGGAGSDITVFRLYDDARLQALPAVRFGATPAVGTGVTIVGESWNRAPAKQYWRLSDPAHPDRAIWMDATGQPNQETAHRQGYYYDPSGYAKRWGTNTTIALDGASPTYVYEQKDSAGNVVQRTRLIGSAFDDLPNEAQLAPGDSGGGVFANNRLVGMNVYNGDFSYPGPSNPQNLGQPANTAVYGNVSYFVDLFSHVDQIASITKVHPGIDGDANLDGKVDNTDFQTLRQNFQTGSMWTQGDFNLDGAVTFADYQLLERNYGMSDVAGATAGTITAPAFDSVPEPGGLGLLAGGLIAVVGRRRRK